MRGADDMSVAVGFLLPFQSADQVGNRFDSAHDIQGEEGVVMISPRQADDPVGHATGFLVGDIAKSVRPPPVKLTSRMDKDAVERDGQQKRNRSTATENSENPLDGGLQSETSRATASFLSLLPLHVLLRDWDAAETLVITFSPSPNSTRRSSTMAKLRMRRDCSMGRLFQYRKAFAPGGGGETFIETDKLQLGRALVGGHDGGGELEGVRRAKGV